MPAPNDSPLAETPCEARPLWDLFCRVVDNRGDAGVGWRLARGLAQRGQRVRLWIDEPDALQGMADEADQHCVAQGHLQTLLWPADGLPWTAAPDAVAVVELFGCTLPDAVQSALARPGAPTWVNLEHLSAEGYVERSHRLASPRMSGPGAGAVTWFFYPGFTTGTGGLLREERVATAEAPSPSASASPWGLPPRSPGDLTVSRFDYRRPHALPWLQAWAASRPNGQVRLVVPGVEATTTTTASPDAQDRSGNTALPGGPSRLSVFPVPWLSQSGYDALLLASDLNLVRGEDSFVRAQWAGRPMVWQIYPQDDGGHGVKLDAWLDRYLSNADAALEPVVRRIHRAWNGFGATGSAEEGGPFLALNDRLLQAWSAHAQAWRRSLLQQQDLTTQLMAFVAEKRLAQNR